MPVKGLTPEEIAAATAAVVAAGGKSTDRANRLPGETATEANARITAGYREQARPELTQEGKAAGATMEFVRTGAGGVGTYKEIFPIGTPVPEQRTTEYGNVYDAQGKLVSGSGLKTPPVSDATLKSVAERNAAAEAKIRAEETAKLLARFKAQGMSDAEAKKAVDKFWADASLAYQRGYEVDENGNQIPMYGSAGSGFFGASGSSSSGSRSLVSAPAVDTGRAERQSAYDLLFQQFNQYGLGALVEPLRGLITSGASPAEFTIRLRETDAYKKRFAANAARIAKGLTAISEAEYIGLEDQYQNIMRNYGLPANYYTRGDMGRQEGFERFIGNDVSAAELEDRIMTAQQRVMNANPEVVASLRQFYPDISNGDILAYALDPDKGLSEIKRKVTAAEIGGGAMQAGLGITGTRAEELGAAGVTKQQAQQGFQTVAEVAPRGGQLAAIYGESPYTQQTAEQEVFGLAGSTEAAKQRRKLVGLERAAFSGQTGAAQGALGRERAGNL
jgi:hypothetical protein